MQLKNRQGLLGRLSLVGLVSVFGALATAAASEPTSAVSVTIKPGPMDEKVGKGFVDVTMVLPAGAVTAGKPLLTMDVVLSNTESVARKLQNLTASDSQGPLTLTAADDPEGLAFRRRWSASRPVVGDLTVSYRAPVDNTPPLRGSGPPVMLRIDGDGVSAAGRMFLMTPETPKPYRMSIRWDLSAMAKAATATSSYGDGDVDLPAGPVNRLQETVFMAGSLRRAPVRPVRGFSSAWLGEPPFDPRPLMDWTEHLHTWMNGFFGDSSGRPYRVFLRFNPINAGGGTALTNSFLTTYNATTRPDSIKDTLSHEMVHTYTASGPGRWYAEGNAVFYEALLPWRAGLFSADDYLANLNGTASRYFSNALIHTPDDQIMPHFWEDTRIRTLAYDRGAMYFAVINAKVRAASGGKRSVDDLIRIMIARARAGQPVDDAAWTAILLKELGQDGVALHHAMLAGEVMTPDSDAFGPCFERTTKMIRRFDLGFDTKSLVGDVKTIRGLASGSEAEKAGLRNGDVVTYSQALDSVQGDVDRQLRLSVTRDGRVFPISYSPRGELVEIYQWARKPGAPESACKL